jgi:molecular chaperone DnaJ
MAKRDYYDVLGVNKTAPIDEIKSNYRKLAMKYHPDRNQGDSEAEEMFKEAAEAYEVLSDQTKRSRYDQYGVEGLKGTDFHTYSNFDEIFSQFGDVFRGRGGIFDDLFSGSSRGGSRRRYVGEKGSDIKIKLPLSLEEIASGIKKTLKIKSLQPCEVCGGSGAKSGTGKKTCPTCQGQGEVRQVSRSIFGQFVNVGTCPSCQGAGEIITEKCDICHGDGRTSGEDKVQITIPAGVEEGNYIPLRGRGNAGKGSGPSGDLIVIIEERKHPEFVRDGHNLIYNLKISFPEAALGTELEIPILNGREKIRIEPGTQPGSHIKLRHKGLPDLNSNNKGDLVVIMNLFVPTILNSSERDLLEQLAESENITPSFRQIKKEKDFFGKIKDAFF